MNATSRQIFHDRLLASTGMRVGELVKLNGEIVNLDEQNVLFFVKEIKNRLLQRTSEDTLNITCKQEKQE